MSEQIKIPLLHDGKPDTRYSTNPKYPSDIGQMIGAHFCGDLIGACRDVEKTNYTMAKHQQDRMHVMYGTDIQ